MARTIKALLFDLDGTLVDTIEDIAAAFSAAIALEGLERASVTETKRVVGRGLVNALKDLLVLRNHEVSEERFNELLAHLYHYYQNHPVVYSKPFDGIVDLVNELSGEYQIGVLSNKEHTLTEHVVDTLMGHLPWEVIRGMDDSYPRKPDPGAFTPFVETMNVSLDEILLIGDSEVDYQSAVNAGCESILVSWGFRPKEALNRLDGATIVDTIAELKEALDAVQ